MEAAQMYFLLMMSIAPSALQVSVHNSRVWREGYRPHSGEWLWDNLGRLDI